MSSARKPPTTRSRAKQRDPSSLTDDEPKKKSSEERTRKRSPGRPAKNAKITPETQRDRSPKKAAKKSPGRKKSPIRSPNSSRRQSPARKSKIKPVVVTEPIVRLPIIKLFDTDLDTDSESESNSYKFRSRRTMSVEVSDIVNNLRSRTKLPSSRDSPDYRELRQRTEDAVVPIQRSSEHEFGKRAIEFSDDDELETLHRSPVVHSNVDYANAFIMLLYVCIELVFSLSLPILCNEKTCQFRYLHRNDLITLGESFKSTALLSIAAFVLFNAILSVIPYGGQRQRCLTPNFRHEYVLNGFFALILQVIALFTLEIYHIPVTLFIINNTLNFITASTVFAFAVGFLLFVKCLNTRETNLIPDFKRNTHLVNFLLGGQIHPRFGPIDVKFVLIRCSIISTVLIVLSFTYQSLEMISLPPVNETFDSSTFTAWTSELLQNVRIRPTLFVMSTLTIIYFAELFLVESSLLTTLEFRGLPWGFMKTLEYVTGAFIYSLMTKYVFDYNVELSNIELSACTAMFVVGYIIYRGSNSQKHAFNENPYGLGTRYESIPTTTGRKLLCSGYWGIVRHPNYLGDIILTLSFTRFVWPSPTMLVIAFIVVSLVLRAIIDNRKCARKYGLAWQRYCLRVPYLLIPKVF